MTSTLPMVTAPDGVQIAYETRGRGVCLVFIAPPVIGKDVFRYQVEELSDSCRIVRFDLRGHGQSGATWAPVTYDTVVEDVRAVLDALEIDQAVLCGYSMGGSIVLEFLRKYPGRALGGILLSGYSQASDKVLRAELSSCALSARICATRVLAFTLAFGNADCTTSFRRMWEAGKTARSKEVADLFSYSIHYNGTQDLPAIVAPVCLVYGGDDKRFHRYGHLLQDRLPRTEFHVIPKIGHQLPTKAARSLNPIISSFVSKLKAGQLGVAD